MNTFLAGALSGLAATAPMTLAMEAMHRHLPRHQRYHLPPRLITTRLLRRIGVHPHLDLPKAQRHELTVAAHYLYGALAGAIYAPLARKIPGHPALKGISFGLMVWSASYLGLLPMLNILPPATQQPARRNALMIVAHLVWGAALGVASERLES